MINNPFLFKVVFQRKNQFTNQFKLPKSSNRSTVVDRVDLRYGKKVVTE
jgi:hypothetical protein